MIELSPGTSVVTGSHPRRRQKARMHSDVLPALQHPPRISAAQQHDRAGGAVILVVDFG
jgi:hypothetical protein